MNLKKCLIEQKPTFWETEKIFTAYLFGKSIWNRFTSENRHVQLYGALAHLNLSHFDILMILDNTNYCVNLQSSQKIIAKSTGIFMLISNICIYLGSSQLFRIVTNGMIKYRRRRKNMDKFVFLFLAQNRNLISLYCQIPLPKKKKIIISHYNTTIKLVVFSYALETFR